VRESTQRFLRPLLVVLGWLGLVAVLVAARFPYDRLTARAERTLAVATGREAVSIRNLSPALGLRGPLIQADSVILSPRRPDELRLESLRFRPALSLGMFRGETALHIDARAAFGRAVGTVYLGAEPGFDGSFDALDLSNPAFDDILPLNLTGVGSIEANVAVTAAGPRGSVAWALADGSIAHDIVPFTIPYSVLRGALHMQDGVIELENLELEGPALSGSAHGTIQNPGGGADAVLDLRVSLREVTPNMRTTLRSFGVTAAADGSAEFALVGTTSAPAVR
jgi:type II secretion system protein N